MAQNGKIRDGSQFAKGEAKISGGTDTLGVNAGDVVTIDPALDSEVQAGFTKSLVLKSGNFNVKAL